MTYESKHKVSLSIQSFVCVTWKDQPGRGMIKAELLSAHLPRGKINEHPQLIIRTGKWINNCIPFWRKLCLCLEVVVGQLLISWFLHMNILKHMFNTQKNNAACFIYIWMNTKLPFCLNAVSVKSVLKKDKEARAY